MAFPAASASVQQIKTPTYGDIMQERDAFMVQQNALAQQQLKQQQNAMLNRAYAEAYDPQTGGVNTNKLFGSLASGGMGAEIPGQMEAVGKGQEATAKGSAAKLKYAQELLTVSRNELGSANTPEEAIMAGQRIAQQYPEAKDSVLQSLAAVQGMTPEQFGAWKMDALRKNLSAEQQLKQHFVTQNLGGSTRVLSMPEYGAGKAQVVPGSEVKVTMSPAQMNPAGRVVQDANGNYVLVNPRTATAAPVTMGGGGGGGGAPALATNPGALKDGAFAKAQPGYAGARGGFAVFDTPEAGVAAQERLLSSAYVGRGVNTIDKIVNRYAPPGPENSGASVSNYKSYIAQRTGLDINAPISPAQVPAVAAAMREFETGQRPGGAPGQPVRAPAKPAAGDKPAGKTTEGERRFGTISQNMADSLDDLVTILQTDPSAIKPGSAEYLASGLPFVGGEARKFARSSGRRQFEASVQALLDNITYVNTGAGVTKKQEESYRTSYVPEYTDEPKDAKRKLERMIRFVKNTKAAAGALWTPDMDKKIAALEQAAAMLGTGGAAPATGGKPSSAPKRLKYNPSTGGFD